MTLRSHRRSAGALLLISGLLATGCASGGNLLRPDTSTSEEVTRLKDRIVDLQRQVRVNEVELARLRERLIALEAGGVPAPRRSATTTRPSTPQQPRTETIAPPEYVPPPSTSSSRFDTEPESSEQIVEQDLELPPSAAEISAAEAIPVPRADEVVRGAEPVAPAVARPEVAPTPATGPTPTPIVPLSAEAQALYDQGYAQFNEGLFVDAETTFRRFLQSHPSTDLSDNAQFWIGEARLARGDVRGALAAFFETVERYPEGNKVPDALLKAARSLATTGDQGGARMTYSELIRRFPQTAAAALAEEERAALP